MADTPSLFRPESLGYWGYSRTARCAFRLHEGVDKPGAQRDNLEDSFDGLGVGVHPLTALLVGQMTPARVLRGSRLPLTVASPIEPLSKEAKNPEKDWRPFPAHEPSIR